MIEVVPARPLHIGTLARRMRDIDKLECLAFDHSPKSALRLGLMGSAIAWTVKIDGRAEAMFGVQTSSLIDARGRPWMLMTDVAARQQKALMRLGATYTEALQDHYEVLENWVHAHNEKSIRWLARLGYAIGSVDLVNGQPMRPFIRTRR